MTKITLACFGDFSENEEGLKELQTAAKKYGVECYATYYDWELKGSRDKIEVLTEDLYSMSADEWTENALTETVI